MSVLQYDGAKKFVNINYGPWDKRDNEKPFLPGIRERPAGANYYPADMTKEEFEVAELPDKKSWYTFLIRDDSEKLITVLNPKQIEKEVTQFSVLLKQAAVLADNEELKDNLTLRAKAFYKGLGYSVKYVSGYELYIINGLDAVLGKYQLAYKLLQRKIKLGDLMPIHQFRTMPYTVYLSLLAEVGYVNDPYTGAQNSLANRWLVGGGPAISVLMYNNYFFQFSYAGNHLGEWGLFIHSRTSF